MFAWDAQQYLKFSDARTRPAAELLARVATQAPANAIDIGCGPGNSTELLAARWRKTQIVGLDSDEAMLVQARKDYPDFRFEQGDIRTWATDGSERYDVVYGNAVLQWVGGHETLFPDLLKRLNPGGTLAIQMPRNFQAPSHVLMRKAAAESPYAARLENVRELNDVPGPSYYYDLLTDKVATLDIWETEYTQVMPAVDGIIDWVKGSGLRPFLARLGPNEQADLLARYRAELTKGYPQQVDGKVLFFFKRIFIVATV
ncbi:trans-aconitate 2-methyltransferase [Lacibacterium aquatile]|uniref:Trans-aconitate 2-methyltransferase n=1 Tax=Lacibacterium aquatile TaxID=1168082 RepID=A0ABW5DNH1_9PROT